MFALYPVDCRIGSLERFKFRKLRHDLVDCRIGSLEIKILCLLSGHKVDCRIGSLEKTSSD